MNDFTYQYEAPPANMDLHQLYRFIFDNGLGRINGERAWTNESLEEAFDFSVSITTLINWRSGKHALKAENIRALAKIVSGGNSDHEETWKKRLLHERREYEQKRKDQKQKKKEDQLRQKGPWVDNIRVCSSREFSLDSHKCSHNVKTLPYGVKKIFVTFELKNIKPDTPFNTRWYHNGEKWKDKHDYVDSAWPNYTFIFNRIAHPAGEYAFRIYVGDKKIADTVFHVLRPSQETSFIKRQFLYFLEGIAHLKVHAQSRALRRRGK